MSAAPVGLLITVATAGFVLAALLSAGEAAVLRVTRSAVSELVTEGHPWAGRVRRLATEPARTASSAAFVRLVAEMTATTCITLALGAGTLPWWQVLLLSVIVSGLIALVIVRISPRTLGRKQPSSSRACSRSSYGCRSGGSRPWRAAPARSTRTSCGTWSTA